MTSITPTPNNFAKSIIKLTDAYIDGTISGITHYEATKTLWEAAQKAHLVRDVERLLRKGI